MRIELHPDAVLNFNTKANSLLLRLIPAPNRQQIETDNFKTDVVTHILDDNNIINVSHLGFVDGLGNKKACYFENHEKRIGLFEEDYRYFIHLLEQIQKNKAIKEFLSKEFLETVIFEWMEKRYKNQTKLEMWDYVSSECEREIIEIEIWIPIAMTQIESQIEIGEVIIKHFSKAIIDESYLEAIKGRTTDEIENLTTLFNNFRKDVQGYAVAIVKVIGEKNRAKERAFEKVEQALSFLRLFSPACIIPEAISYTVVKGKENLESNMYFTNRNNKLIGDKHGYVRNPFLWKIDNQQIEQIFNDGLKILNNLLLDNQKNEFIEKLFDSLYIYSRCTLAKNLSDKLIYIHVSLESILLRDENEPIAQNIGDRIAYAIARKGNERRDIVHKVKKAYELRSKFIHHGIQINDIETMQSFMEIAWVFFHFLIINGNKFKTKEEMLNTLDELKYNG